MKRIFVFRGDIETPQYGWIMQKDDLMMPRVLLSAIYDLLKDGATEIKIKVQDDIDTQAEKEHN